MKKILQEDIEKLEAHKMSKEQLDKYNMGMEKGLVDKLFFQDHIPHYDLLVDFGTANGSLIKAAEPYDPQATYIGYDISSDMLSAAQSNNKKSDKIIFTEDWNLVEQKVKEEKGISLLTLNSVLHEVYSYSPKEEYEHFWSQAFRTGFTYISIRDMMMRQKKYDKVIPKDELYEVLDKMMSLDHGEEKISSFEDIYGNIETEGKLIHLLLKWNYWENWDREVHEHYLGIYIDDFFKRMNTVGKGIYDVAFYKEFTLPYLKNWVKEQIGYDIKVPTHVKILLKKKA
jgi:hypothetical protein